LVGPAENDASGDAWHSMDPAAALTRLDSDANGLSPEEAKRRSERSGKNRLSERRERSWWREAAKELTEPMILLLFAIGVLYSIWGKLEDSLTIFAVITTLVFVEIYNEIRAERTIEALNKLSEPTTTVRRNGMESEVVVEELVPGDIIVLEAGRRVPADARLLESYGLEVEEAALTGESMVQEKAVPSVPPQVTLADRTDMAFAGTVVTKGRGTAVVTATGMGTELGRIAGLARREHPPRTVLQRTMNDLTKWMVLLAVGFSVLVPLLGWLVNGQDPQQMLLTGLSLAFATIPEELPIIITMVLAIGGYRLSKENAVVKRLQAVETLGAVTVICADKTGTLTVNRMEVQEVFPSERREAALRLAALANDARLTKGEVEGDPMDIALVKAATIEGLDVASLRAQSTLITEHTFDNVRKRMSVIYRADKGDRVAVKGSPESVLSCSSTTLRNDSPAILDDEGRTAILEQAAAMASRGLRVLAVAEKEARGSQRQEDVESDLIFVGLIGLADPPRPEAREAIETCSKAGIRVIMLTGDHPLTAVSIATQVGLRNDGHVLTGGDLDRMTDEQLRRAVSEENVCARVTPEHKLRIVKALRANGELIAVTGDGINDAPTLSSADIGIAMGRGGTDVAREAADMVLEDNNFATITRAVKEGRVLFDNLTKGVRYYLACKVALIAISLIAVLAFLPIPFTPVQIILLELFMDLGAAAAFVAERSDGTLMSRSPRDPQASFMDRPMVRSIFVSSLGLILAVTAAYFLTWNGTHDLTRSQTMAFVTWLIGHALLALNMRSQHRSLFKIGPLSNPTMVVWAGAAILFAVAVTTVPFLYDATKTTALSGTEWALALALAVAGSFWLEVLKAFKNGMHK
jgi:P-type Ca2+ transporter type 2C